MAAASPGSIPSSHFWVLSQRWVQFKVFVAIPKAWGALPRCTQQSRCFPSTPGAPPWISAVVHPQGTDSVLLRTPALEPNTPALSSRAGACQTSGCAYKAVFVPARLPARHFILIFFVLGHVHRREDKLLKTIWISAYFKPGQPDRAATGDSGSKAVDPTHCSQARPSLASKDLSPGSKLLFWKRCFI